jgi:hypothetical protein
MDESVSDAPKLSVNQSATEDQEHDGIIEIDNIEAQQENIETIEVMAEVQPFLLVQNETHGSESCKGEEHGSSTFSKHDVAHDGFDLKKGDQDSRDHQVRQYE